MLSRNVVNILKEIDRWRIRISYLESELKKISVEEKRLVNKKKDIVATINSLTESINTSNVAVEKGVNFTTVR